MAETPCGCERAREAAALPEGSPERELREADAAAYQARWRCPLAGHPMPDGTPLPDDCADTAGAVARLTGFVGCETCPMFYARLPWVNTAARARAWREAGDLRSLVGWPSGALADAIDAVEAGINARQAYELERAKTPSKDDDG